MLDFHFHNGQKHIVALVGAGGKTTVMYELADYYASLGLKVLVTTSTHIMQPTSESLPFKVVGTVEKGTGKLTALPKDELLSLMQAADLVLIEADGAKHKPCKVPRAGEPVIYDECTDVIGVVGMDALGGRVQDVCFRTEQVCELLACDGEHILTEADIAKILLSDKGTRKNVGNLPYYIVLNKCDTEELRQRAEKIKAMLIDVGMNAEHIILCHK